MGLLSFICCCLHHRSRVCVEGSAAAAGGDTASSLKQPLNSESPAVPILVPHFPVNPNLCRL
ncbi:hypothetical protein D8674_011301 [Pyrus ussuriensis x Pyrus communis]|uniref:Uncharacterized protein n=1 Tax=Pyrus ussuriensis x Pyrus communis TaxID=2448454 RepID=A0A5N5FYF0_9ROSA|nr:hypothetical protein D8674_011301 [Pyrus ussuriensis x Pyrus communis]